MFFLTTENVSFMDYGPYKMKAGSGRREAKTVDVLAINTVTSLPRVQSYMGLLV
jgi:hypothetical protein